MRQGKSEEALAEYRMACELLQKLADEFPAIPNYQRDLSVYYRSYAKLICDEGNPHESLKWFDQAVRTAKPVYDLAPHDVAAREILRDGHWGRALAYEQLKQPRQAIEDWNQTIELSAPVEQLEFQAIRATSLLHAGMVAEAVDQVVELSIDPRWRAEQWYGFACIFAVASGRIADKRQEYADGAMNLLQLAVQSGFQDITRIAHDKELDALRDRDDFKKLLAELEKQ